MSALEHYATLIEFAAALAGWVAGMVTIIAFSVAR